MRIISRLNPSQASVDEWYSGYAATVPAMAGSLLTFLYFVAGIWAVMNAAVRRYPLAIPPRAIPFALASLSFPAAMLLAGLAAEHRDELSDALLASAAFIFVPLLIARYRFSEPVRSFAALVAYAPLGAAGGLAIGLVQFFRDAEPASGGAGNAAVFGTAMALLAALSLAGVFGRSLSGRTAAIAGFAAGMAGLLLSQSRTLYPMLFILPLLVLAMKPSRRMFAATAVALALVVAVAAIGSHILVGGFRQAVHEFARIKSEDILVSSLGLRAALWSASVQAYAESPLLGHGPQNKMDAVVDRIDERVSYTRVTHVHNGLLDAAVSAGTAGMLGFLAVMFLPLRMVFGQSAESRPRRYVVLSTLCIFGLANLTGAPFDHDLLLVMFLLPLIVVAAADPDPRNVVFWRGRKPG